MESEGNSRRFPIGAERVGEGAFSFRVWAPKASLVELVIESGPGAGHILPLEAEADGYHNITTDAAGAGSIYRYRLDRGALYPDPASRYQPQGPHGPSMVIDATAFEWRDHDWRGPDLTRPVIYEMHIGTYTPEGTFAAAQEKLPLLAEIGVSVVEVMPIADFAGRFGWGYDGVDLFAPTRLYGMPADVRRFVQRAHQLGIAVILDVVYNHFGPDGSYLRPFSDAYFSTKHRTDWGEAINFDGPGSGPVREFFIANAGYWIEEFHMDGLRVDATQNVYDDSSPHILAEIADEVRRRARGRVTFVTGENEPQDVRLLADRRDGGMGFDALWNDDFHHAARVAVTGRRDAYFVDYTGSAQELISACKWGYLYQGQYYSWQRKHRGTPAFHIPASRFIDYLQNHDQIANSWRGERLHQIASPSAIRAITALLLLGPATPLLFQGQEFGASSPFLYFADHKPELANLVREGRHAFLAQFPGLSRIEAHAVVPDPGDLATFEASKLRWGEREANAATLALHRDLIRLSREDPVLVQRRADRMAGAVLGGLCFLLRHLTDTNDDRLLIVNLGADVFYVPAPEPLLAPPAGRKWRVVFNTNAWYYGGPGAADIETNQGWRIPAESTVLLVPEPVLEVEL